MRLANMTEKIEAVGAVLDLAIGMVILGILISFATKFSNLLWLAGEVGK